MTDQPEPRVSTGADRDAEGTAIPGYQGEVVERGTVDLNATKLSAFRLAQRAFPRDSLVGEEHDADSVAFLVRYDGKVWRVTVAEA